jgi:hypothetical protein
MNVRPFHPDPRGFFLATAALAITRVLRRAVDRYFDEGALAANRASATLRRDVRGDRGVGVLRHRGS